MIASIRRCRLPLVCALIVGRALAEAPPIGQLPNDVTPLAYKLSLEIDPRADRFSGQVRIRVKLANPRAHLWLHAREIDVGKIELTDARGRVHQASLAVRDPTGLAEVSFDTTLPAQEVELAIDYSAAFNGKLQGLYKVKVGSDAYAMTQMEATSARYAFPSFDEPRFKTPFEIRLKVPKDDVAIANAAQTEERISPGLKSKTLTFATTKPLPTYLIAFAVGPWDVVQGPVIGADAQRREPIVLRGIGPRGTGPQFRWILDQTPAIVEYFERYTQQPYPFGKLDLLGAPDFGAGAMENAGLIIFRDALLRIDAQSTASTYRSSFNVNAHEIAHQWFGDLVTVPWWNDIWLNEAFATWAQAKATVDLQPGYRGDLSRLEGTLGAMRSDSLLSARKIRQPIRGNDDIQTAFDSITYQKGAAVLRMFEQWLGEDPYRQAMRAYLARHAFGSGSSDDLIATIARFSGKGGIVGAAMRSFLDQPGIPLVHTQLSCRNAKATLALSQSRYLPYGTMDRDHLKWTLPVCVRFDRGGKPSRQCFLLDRPQREFAVDEGCADAYLPNAGADGYYRFSMAEADAGALRARAASLPPAEQIIYADSIASAFVQGSITAGALLDAVAALSSADTPQVATALLGRFDWIREYLADDAVKQRLDAYASELFVPRITELGFARSPADTDQRTELRVRLVGFLALVAKDQEVRRRLNDEGRIALGIDSGGKVDLSRLDPDLRAAALAVTVQQSGTPAVDAIIGELAVNHRTRERYEMLAALGETLDPALGERVRNFGLTPAVAVGEIAYLFSSHVSEAENQSAFFQWLKLNYQPLADRLPDKYQNYLVRFAAAGRCSQSEAEEIQSWFAPRIAKIIGGERFLAQSLEAIGQCAALRSHLGVDSLAAWSREHPAK